MVPLLVALVFQASNPTPCPQAGQSAAQADSGWTAYRRGAIADASVHFAAADSLCPGDHSTQVGLGFVRLRQNQPRAAADRFLRAVGSDTRDPDAWYGLGLARARLKDQSGAVIAWRRALTLAPGYGDVELQILALGIDSGLTLPALRRPEAADVPARTAGDGFEIQAAREGGWEPFYVKGVNLGVALPGHFASEFPTDDSTYARWLELIAGARANAVRVYTILPPAFYRALKAWNAAHPDSGLWLLHGVWTELPPRQDYDNAAWKAAFRAEMRRVVDVVHGHALIAARPGHAFGRYDADVSDHVLAFIIGREWEPFSITVYNRRRRGPPRTMFTGRFLAVDRGTPADVWMAEQCDYLLGYDWDSYHAQRPIAYTNWPPLDPLSHATEPTLEEEQRLRRLHGFPPNPRLKEYDNDRESLDAMLVRTTAADLGGYFASYHVYPYYPDFIGLDSAYGAVPGQSHYLGYLRDLKRHHSGRPLLVAEYGVPSSRGVSHLDADGMDHGGHDERAMAQIDALLTREIREAGAAGGILFAWLDEWFKHTWATIDLEVPAERTRLWHNVEDAEQSYGLLGEYAGPWPGTPEPGGDPGAWQALPLVGQGSSDTLTLRGGSDPSYLYLALAGGPRLGTARYVVGIDTYRRGEFQLALNDTSDAQLLVAPWYNPYLGPRKGMGPTALDRFYNEAATVNPIGQARGAPFDSLFVTTNRWRIGRDGRTHAARGVNRGRLRYGRTAESTLSDWYVEPSSGLIEIRLAWGLLNVTDPSSRRVMVRYRRDGVFETARTDGFRFAVAALDRASGRAVARLEPERTYAWPTWEVPVWHERLKPAYFAMREVWGSW
ncbi:MAG TPA: tetratricopeptide repeat protein [Gemmatimonadales bacterium]|nr:tetratricopeptide repeat protein [Gemmatimonadales bacterium]